MKIERYNIPKLPRNKYASTGYSINVTGGNSGNTYNYTMDLYDGLDSESTEEALTANQGRVLNDKIEQHKTEVSNNYIKNTDAFDSFLSKKEDDTALGKITFSNGLISNNMVSNNLNITDRTGYGLTVDNFSHSIMFLNKLNVWYTITTPNVFFDNSVSSKNSILDEKGFIATKNDDDTVTMQVDNLDVFGNLNVKTLEVEESKYIGGDLYCTLAGLIISKVETFDTHYKVYFLNEKDGVKINNKFSVNDLAFSQTFNNTNVRKYWYKVIEVQEDNISLSRSECLQGSNIPEVGDSVVQLGNTTDTTRQGALIISPNAMKIYDGISTFTLPNPNIVLSPKGTKIDASTINFLGQTLINNNFVVDESGNLSINGKVTTNEGSIGNFKITDKGIYNNAVTDGDAEIIINNSMLGGQPEYYFEVKNTPEAPLTNIFARGGVALSSSSEGGVAAEFDSHSSSGWSIKTNNRCLLNGVHLNVKYMDDSTVDSLGHGNIYLIDDFVIFGYEQDRRVYMPDPKGNSGKIYHMKHLGAGNITLTAARIIRKGGIGYSSETLLDSRGMTYTFITDGVNWFEI